MKAEDALKYFNGRDYYYIKKEVNGDRATFSTSKKKPINNDLKGYTFCNYSSNGHPIFVRYYE